MKKVRFLDPAEQEMLNAARYYESQAVGLGEDFLSKVESAVRDVAERPEMWRVIRFEIRRRLVHRFPYGILYRIGPGGDRCRCCGAPAAPPDLLDRQDLTVSHAFPGIESRINRPMS